MRTRLLRGVLVRAAAPALAMLCVAVAARDLSAQTPFVPYFGKNQIHYNNFEWYIYKTDHFEIYYYPEIEQHLERVVSYAESAYQQVSADLKHDLAFKVPLIIFRTHSEFEQQNVIPGAAQEGVLAFAEPYRDRMLLPIDEPPDRLYGLITHELTHVFQFDIIPQSLVRRQLPLWMSEGQADYERGLWDPLDLMTVRDAAVADIVPKMSKLEGYGDSRNPRLIYNLGHAVFEFIESRWGKEGVRQFMFSLRKSVIGGGEDAYGEAFQLKPDEFDQQFDKYLKDRFKPFRDKERPADYGRNLAPDPEKGPFVNALSIEASPSGDLLAVATGNRRDGELDIVLVSAKDGSVVRNLTPGFDKDLGFEYISIPSQFIVPWMSWGAKGDRLAYFVRTEKSKSLILQNVLSQKIEQRIEVRSVDEPESPSISPDGQTVAFAGLRGAVGDIFTVNLATGEIINLTSDDFADSAPTFSPDGKFIVYLARVSGNYKLFRLDLDTKKKTQLTFGTHDDGAAKFVDVDELVFPSTATDPNQALEPEVAKNGIIYNLWTLNLKNGELRQYTDALGGNLSPAVLGGQSGVPRIAFVSYYKNDYTLEVLEPKEPLKKAASADFGAPAPLIDFQAPLSHTFIGENKRKKRPFEKLFLDGAPPVNVGLTSGGDLFGGTALSFSDVLGDKQISLIAASISQYRTMAFSYANLSRRFQWAAQGFSQTLFYYGQLGGVLYDPIYSGLIDRDLAVATRTVRGGTVYGIYPMNRYTRLEFSGGIVNYQEAFNDPQVQQVSDQYQQQQFGRQLFRNGTFAPFTAELVQETTVFREFGPLAGSTMRLSYSVAPKVGNFLSRQTADLDGRYYLRLGGTGLLALRARGFKSWGTYPDFLFFGGNSEMHGYQYLEFLGQNVFFGDAELRFPFIEAMATPIGVLGGIRGVMFFNVGGGWFNDQPFKFWDTKPENYTLPATLALNPNTGRFDQVGGDQRRITGFRLRDSRASYGIGLETFALGFPIHFDWSWRTLFNKTWEDALFSAPCTSGIGGGIDYNCGGSSRFRRPKFDVWIGYDF